MSSSATRIRCIAPEPLAGEGRRQLRCLRPAGDLSGARRRRPRRRRRCLPVLFGVPLLRTLFEVLPALGVPRAGAVMMTTPAPRSSEDPPDHEEDQEEEQDREQEEAGEE